MLPRGTDDDYTAESFYDEVFSYVHWLVCLHDFGHYQVCITDTELMQKLRRLDPDCHAVVSEVCPKVDKLYPTLQVIEKLFGVNW